MTNPNKPDRKLVSRSEAHQLLNIPLGTLRSWTSRKELTAARIGAGGRHLYYLDEIQTLASKTRRRKTRHA